MTAVDKEIFLWINGLAGRSSVLDTIMAWLANDYFVIVSMSLILLAIWFMGHGREKRELYQRAVICALITIGFAGGLVLAANHIWRHPHPFEAVNVFNPETLQQIRDNVARTLYFIHDPAFPSNTSAVTFAAAAGLWQKKRKLGYLMLTPAVLMPLSKIYAGVYWPSDIVAGAILGIATSYLIRYVVLPVVEPLITWILATFRKFCIA